MQELQPIYQPSTTLRAVFECCRKSIATLTGIIPSFLFPAGDHTSSGRCTHLVSVLTFFEYPDLLKNVQATTRHLQYESILNLTGPFQPFSLANVLDFVCIPVELDKEPIVCTCSARVCKI